MHMVKEWQEIQFIKSDGTIYNLHSPPTRAVLDMTGWGKPPQTFHTTSGPFQHGETPISYRLTPRTIGLTLVHKYLSRSELYNGRSELLSQLGINNASPNSPLPGVLRWHYLVNGIYMRRDLDVFTVRGLGFAPLSGWRQQDIQEDIEFTAFNPIIYDPTLITSTINSFTGALVFPMTFPFVLGTTYGTTNITYTGTWEEYPVITVTGPASNVYIENSSTGKKLQLNYTISLGETVTFTLTYDHKSVTSSTGADLSSFLSDDSDLGEFTLQYDPIIAGGVNNIIVYVVGPTATTVFTLTYHNRYYGI